MREPRGWATGEILVVMNGPADIPAVTPEDGEVDGEAAVERTARLLRARGERMTGPRRAVVTALASTGGHLGADAVLDAVARIDPSVHRASVFRALGALSAAGVLHHVHEGHGSTVYHLRDSPHLHAQCRTCGTMIDVRVDLLDGVAGDLDREVGFVLDPEHVALSGICERCRSI